MMMKTITDTGVNTSTRICQISYTRKYVFNSKYSLFLAELTSLAANISCFS
jgi:hypothetical protein